MCGQRRAGTSSPPTTPAALLEWGMALQLRPGDYVDHLVLRNRTGPAVGAPQRYVVMAVLKLGVRLQEVNAAGHPTGRVILVGHEHLERTVQAAS